MKTNASTFKKLSGAFVLTLFIAACLVRMPVSASEKPSADITADLKQTESGVVTFACFGDNLIHMPITKYGMNTGSYDFLFEHVKDRIAMADLAVINQETPFINDPKRYAGYPMFGSPAGIADAIADAGFDIVTCATNHSLDQGLDGIRDTAAAFQKREDDLVYLGIHLTQEDSDTIKYLDCNGIRFAFLNYTYGTNGIPVPKSAPWCVDLLSNKNRVVSQLQEARKNADAVIVFAHWGTEYQYTPDSYQKTWTQTFLENGVDIVVGGHPHVIQPYEMLKSDNGHEMLVYYSLGNFVSCQNRRERLLGGLAMFTLHKTDTGTKVIAYTMAPTVTLQAYPLVTGYLLEDFTQEIAARQVASLYASPAYYDDLFARIITGR